ncbi:MAG: hypothetical protein Q9207_003241 [Kuettlingeria erythrocarpa]
MPQSQFLKHLFNFDVSHEVELARISSRAESCLWACAPSGRQITARMRMILDERSQYHGATCEANPDSMDDPYPTALLLLYRQVREVVEKVRACTIELQDVIRRARQQHALLFRGLMTHGGRFEPPIPVEVDSLFRPGRRVAIVWEAGRGGPVDLDHVSITADDGEPLEEFDETVPDLDQLRITADDGEDAEEPDETVPDLDQLSITADDGGDARDPDEIVPDQHTEAETVEKVIRARIKFGSFS